MSEADPSLPPPTTEQWFDKQADKLPKKPWEKESTMTDQPKPGRYAELYHAANQILLKIGTNGDYTEGLKGAEFNRLMAACSALDGGHYNPEWTTEADAREAEAQTDG